MARGPRAGGRGSPGPGDDRGRRRRGPGRDGRLRGAARGAPIVYAGDLRRGSAARARPAAARTWWSPTRTGAAASSPSSATRTWAARSPENERISENFASIEPFPDARQRLPDGGGPAGAALPALPERGRPARPSPSTRAISAFDGDPSTTWTADRYLRPEKRWIEIGFTRPRDVPWVELYPIRDWRGVEKEVAINGVRAKLGPGRDPRSGGPEGRPSAAGDDHEGGPAAGQPPRVGRLPGDPDPRGARAPVAAHRP